MSDGGDRIDGTESTLQFIDTHAHLDDPQFDVDRADVIARAAAAGVERIVLIGYHEAGWARAVETARSFTGGAVCLGVHPANADEFDEGTPRRLATALSAAGRLGVAIGETGIDLFRPGPPIDQQCRAFTAQLELARELGVPTVIHQRAAEQETLDVLSATPADQPIILHSFEAGPDTAAVARERGWYLGVGGLMTRKASIIVRDILVDFPLDRLLLETDSPYLVPTGVKSRRNEPAYLVAIARRLADLRGVSVERIAWETTANASRVFGLSDPTDIPDSDAER